MIRYQQWLRYREFAELSNNISGIWQRLKNIKATFCAEETMMHFWCRWRRVNSSGDTCIFKCQLASHLSITATKRLRQLGSTECETQYIPFYILNCLWNKRSLLKLFYSRAVNLSILNAKMLSTRRYADTKKWSILPCAITMAQTDSFRTTQIIKNTFNKRVCEFNPTHRNATRLILRTRWLSTTLWSSCDNVREYIIHPRHIIILSTELFWVASRCRRLWKVTIDY